MQEGFINNNFVSGFLSGHITLLIIKVSHIITKKNVTFFVLFLCLFLIVSSKIIIIIFIIVDTNKNT